MGPDLSTLGSLDAILQKLTVKNLVVTGTTTIYNSVTFAGETNIGSTPADHLHILASFPDYTPGSIPFFASNRTLAQDNSGLGYDSTLHLLLLGTGIVTPKVGPATSQQHTVPAVASDTLTLLAASQAISGKTSYNNVAITAPAVLATLVLGSGKTLTFSNTLTFTATDGATLAIGAGGTLGSAAYTSSGSYQPVGSYQPLDATLTSLSGKSFTGTGAIALASSPTFTAPTLGIAVATSLNGLIVSTTTGTFTLTNGKVLTVSNTLTLAGTDGTTITFQGTDTYVGRATTDTFTNKVFDTGSTGNSLRINGTAVSAVTGTGSVVLATSPTLVTPVLGVATATTLNGLTITATTGILTVAALKTLTVQNTLTLTATDGSTLAIGAGGTLGTAAYTSSGTYQPIDGTLTSLSGKTISGTGNIAFTTSPVFTTPTLGVATATTVNGLTDTTTTGTLTIANGKTFTVSNGLTLTGTDSTSFAFPAVGDTVGCLATAQTWSATQTHSADIVPSATNTRLLGSTALAFQTVFARAIDTDGAQQLNLKTNGVSRISLGSGGGITISDANNIGFGTGTGTQLGGAANQKLSFHGAPAVIQRASAAQAAVITTGSTLASFGYATAGQADSIVTLVNELRAALVEKGLIKGSA